MKRECLISVFLALASIPAWSAQAARPLDVSCNISGNGVNLEARYPATETTASQLAVSNLHSELIYLSFERQALDGTVIVEVTGHDNFVAASGKNLTRVRAGLNGGALGVIDVDPTRKDGEVAPRQVLFELNVSNSANPLTVTCDAMPPCHGSECGKAIMPAGNAAGVPGVVQLVTFN